MDIISFVKRDAKAFIVLTAVSESSMPEGEYITFKAVFKDQDGNEICKRTIKDAEGNEVKLEAIDDILSRKVMRKLEAQNPVYVRNASEGLCNYLDEVFGVDKMPLCKEVIRQIEQNV